MSRTLDVMRAAAQPVAVAESADKTAVILATGRHYSVTLRPQADVHFAVPPARPSRDPAPYGGSLRFTVAKTGRYRVALTTGHWIDVVDGANTIDSLDHQGARDCALVHKIVEFELPAGRPLTLQISGRAEPVLELAIVPVEASSP